MGLNDAVSTPHVLMRFRPPKPTSPMAKTGPAKATGPPRPADAPEVAVVCQLFYPELVSTGQSLTELIEELSSHGLGITVLASQPTVIPGSKPVARVIEHHGFKVQRTWSTRFSKTSFLGKLMNLSTFFLSATWEVLRRHRGAQLLLLTNPPYLPMLGWLCHLLRQQTFGVIMYDIMPEQAELLNFIKPNGLAARAWRRLNGAWYRRAAFTVVISHDMLDGAIRNADLGGTAAEPACRAKTHIIYVWSDDRHIVPIPKSASREAQRLRVTDRFVVQYSGNHARFHDIETLLGIAKTFARDQRFAFQFIGEGQKKRVVDSYAKSERPAVVYSSTYVPKELLSDSLAMADVGVVAQMPGQERVCYPSKLLGVMAAGRAILAICSPDCEMARMILEHELGWVVPNGDIEGGRRSLLEAFSDPSRVARMGENGARLLRERFTLAKAAHAYYQLIMRYQTKGP